MREDQMVHPQAPKQSASPASSGQRQSGSPTFLFYPQSGLFGFENNSHSVLFFYILLQRFNFKSSEG
jgi:hypothetical protein